MTKLGKIHPELGDRWHWKDFLQINQGTPLENLPKRFKNRDSLTPLEILTFASTDPDDGRDQDLFIRDGEGRPQYAYRDQFWFGSVQGPNSQAFRHIENPPFNIRHPLATIGLPFRSLGEATRRAEIYFQASQLAFALEEPYWGWRLLGGSFHYLQDLHQPYHAGLITPSFILKGLKVYLDWGREKLGLLPTFAHLVSNSHRAYESFVSFPPANYQKLKKAALKQAQGTDHPPLPNSVHQLALQVRDQSNLALPTLFDGITEVGDPILLSPYKLSDHPEDMKNPVKLIQKDPKLDPLKKELFEITSGRFESCGEVLRTVTHEALEQKKKANAKELLNKLADLLPRDPRDPIFELDQRVIGDLK